ncbi:MAG: NADH-ubiquinone oxidoreductase-F iron-sulfur binding region domain-containing protein [Bacteroidales bacterium]
MKNKEELISFLNENALNGQQLSTESKNILSFMRKDRISKPMITVSQTSSSIVSGSLKSYKAIQDYLQERDIDANLQYTGSLGLHPAEPVVSIQLPGMSRILFKTITAEKVISLLDNIFNHIVPRDDVLGQIRNRIHTNWQNIPFLDELDFFKNQQRNVLRNCGLVTPETIDDYIANNGYATFVNAINRKTPDELISIIKESKLRGRSGSGYFTGKKWEKTLHSEGNQKYVICNAVESDPGAFMERFIAESDPHRIIEGTALAAYAVGAGKAFLYVSYENTLAIERLRKAIHQAKELGLLGDNIFNSGYNLELSLFVSPGAFVCGQETAMLNSIEGKRGVPSERPPYPTEKGLFGNPTLINNLETLANVPDIIQNGADWFQQYGNKNNPGTKVFSVAGKATINSVVEVPMGTTFDHIFFNIAAGTFETKTLKAFLLGGPAGHVLPAKKSDLTIDFDILKQQDIRLGSGGLIIMNEDTCMVDISRYITGFLQEESCGKCITCREGTQNMLNILKSISQRPEKEPGNQTLERFKGVMSVENLAEVIRDTSLCGLGENAPNIVLDTLKYFRNEYEEHIFERKCAANVCRDLRTFYIDVDQCVGCAVCINKCPVDAIYGLPKHPHFIIENRCIGCGLCYDACMFNAIFVK